MPRVHHVKAARKDNPVASQGEPYYWWKFRYGGKRYSKTYPKQSETTGSEFLSTAYSIQEDIEALVYDPDTIQEDVEGFISEIQELREQTEESLQNMPDSLQEGPTGELLQSRVDTLDDWESNLDSIELGIDEDATKEEKEEAQESIMEELQSYSYEGE